MKYIFKIFLIVGITSLVAGCDLDVNEDPNRITESTISGALIFPAAAHGTGQMTAARALSFLNNWIGYWAWSGTFALDATETTYNITPSFSDALWAAYYNVLFDLDQARVKSLASKDTLTAGASIILSADLCQHMVDIFGNIPYSQAFKYGSYQRPDYDDAREIYSDLQIKLDLAISFMEIDGPGTTFASIDIVNHGDRTKWIHMANTLKLRLLIRQSEVPGFNPSAELTKIIAKGGVLQSGETVYVNPGYEKAVNKQSPFYNNYGFTAGDVEAASSVRANKYFVNTMQAYGDPRLSYYFIPLSGAVVGNIYGLPAGNPQASSGIGSGLAKNPAQDQWILTSVESLFLEAEAIERGWLPGNPATKYNEAVTESFVFLGIPNASTAAAAHLGAFPYIAGNLKRTLYQKYLALCGLAPIEAWSDLRRIGFDIIPTTVGGVGYFTSNPAVTSTTIPIRLLYPQNEYTTNTENVLAEGTIDQFTSRIFWDVN